MSLLLEEVFSWLADSSLVVSSYDRSAAVDTTPFVCLHVCILPFGNDTSQTHPNSLILI